MKKQLLYYEHIVPVSARRHLDWSLEVRADYEFAGHSNSVPLSAAEFSAAAMEYAIVFTESEQAVQPAVILGLKPDENHYLDEKNQWNASYIPAFVRRYPFVFSKSEDDNTFILCVDEQYAGWNQGDRGNRLFDANGQGTDYFNDIFEFLKNYQRQFNWTQAFCQKLEALDLLEPMRARFKLPSGQNAELTGFMAIDRDKLKALPGDKLAELAKTGELELMYIHLQSMRNFNAMLVRATGDVANSESSQEAADLIRAEEPLH